MAIRFAKQTGNWSDVNTWDDGSTLPQAGDDVYLNGFNIEVDQNVTVLSISNGPTPIGVPLSIIPNMTGKTTPTGVGQAFANQNDANAWLSFRKPASMPNTVGWVANSRPAAIGYLYDTSKIIKRYAWRQNSDTNRRPRDWTFEGSNDGSTWFVLDTVTGSSVTTYYSSVLANTTPYTHYRINVSVTNGSNQAPSFDYIDMTESTNMDAGWGSGGTATISTARTVNADLYHNTGTLITISATSPSVVNINGNMPGTVAKSYNTGINMTGNSTLNYVGNVIASASTDVQQTGIIGISVSTGGTLNVTGDVIGGGNLHNNFGQGATVGVRTGASSIVNIVGNVSSGIGTYSNVGVQNTQNATVNITGNIENRPGLGGPAFFNTLNLGFYLGTGTSLCSVIGNVTANAGGHGVHASANPVKITGNLTNSSNGLMAFIGPILFLEQPTQWQFRKLDLSTITLYTPGVATGHPAEANVRTGVVYGPTNNLTGTCAVPPAAAVSIGVPVDNTVGTGYLNATDIWNVPLASITTPNSIGERLKDASTVQSTGAQLAAFL